MTSPTKSHAMNTSAPIPPSKQMLIRDFPNELIIIIGAYLPAPDLYHLILVSRCFSSLLLSHLRTLAVRPQHAAAALFWATICHDRGLLKHVLEKSEENFIVGQEDPDIWQESVTIHRAPGKCNDNTIDTIINQDAVILLEFRDIPRTYGLKDRQPAGWAIRNEHYALLRLALSTDNRWNSAWQCAELLLFAAQSGKGKAIDVILKQVDNSDLALSYAMGLLEEFKPNLEAARELLAQKKAESEARRACRMSALGRAVRYGGSDTVGKSRGRQYGQRGKGGGDSTRL